jgi:UDP-glucose:glycoprotein glucosyltransferase
MEDFDQLLSYEKIVRISPAFAAAEALGFSEKITTPLHGAKLSSIVALSGISDVPEGIFEQASTLRINAFEVWNSKHTAIEVGNPATAGIKIIAAIDPASEQAQRWLPILKVLSELSGVYMKLYLNPKDRLQELPVKRFYRYVLESQPRFNEDGSLRTLGAAFTGVPQEALLTVGMDVPPPWLVAPKNSVYDLDNIKLSNIKSDVSALYELENILIEGHSREVPGTAAPRGAQLVLSTERDPYFADTTIMANLGYFQFKANPGFYNIDLQKGRSSEIYKVESLGPSGWTVVPGDDSTNVALMSFQGTTLYPRISRRPGKETEDVLEIKPNSTMDYVSKGLKFAEGILGLGKKSNPATEQADINIFSVASGHLYERMLNIMMVSVMKHTKHTVKFWFIEQFLSPSFKDFIPHLAAEYGFEYEMVTYKWPHWLRAQTEKQREIWGYKILFLDVLFPLSLEKVIFVDADQIVRTDMIELVNHDLKGAPYGFTPMCDSRTEMEGFRFWNQGYWKGFLKGLPYHISALYVVDLNKFRQIAAGDRLRQQYHQLSADPGSLSNLDQDLPNHMQSILPIHSLPQEWLWCETWCSDESLKDAKTIDLCNNPQTKEPKLDRARRQVPEWTVYDDEIAAVDRKRRTVESDPEVKNTKSRNFEEPKPSGKDEL